MMGLIRAGDLDRRVTIQEEVKAGQRGAQAPVWKDIDLNPVVWASKMDITGRERIMGVVEVAKGASVIRIRWRSDISPSNRLVVDGVIHDIEHMAELGRKEGWDITTRSTGEKV